MTGNTCDESRCINADASAFAHNVMERGSAETLASEATLTAADRDVEKEDDGEVDGEGDAKVMGREGLMGLRISATSNDL